MPPHMPTPPLALLNAGAVERWLLESEGCIRRTLHKVAGEALAAYAKTDRSKWILEWPGQIVLNCSQVGSPPTAPSAQCPRSPQPKLPARYPTVGLNAFSAPTTAVQSVGQ